ncbi:MAG: Rrf2 family transcriptional regulator [Brevefilum sp.]|nr:Rrf2 family transcriptional regulator [Brevefilum sp.]MDT8381953.1 Rrf2 family transcriptional regulator [Brevefilum sp.]MDW7754709.1 Rrf2 family transcriptional regulator [Brevefilum sp.]
MQITRQADYALRAMLYLAREYPKKDERAATSKIAEEQEIPASFLAKIISQLSIAGLIQTSRGAKGGVRLARKPEEISLLDVVEAIDGPISLNECVDDPSVCSFGDNCPIHEVWCEAKKQLVRKLRDATFDKLLEQQKAKV